MTFWGKVLLGLAGVVVSSSIGTTVAYRDSLFNSSLPDNKVVAADPVPSNSQSGCYVVPTEESNSQTQLLVCKGQDTLNGGDNSEYFLYNKDGNKTKAKVATIKKKDSQLEVILKESLGTVTLSVKSEDWTNFSTESDLEDACNLEVYPENNGGTKWKCSNGLGVAEKEIKLKEFKD